MTTRTRPMVAIVGRPNVGKSTLLNRIVGSRIAIVEERPGVTRDRKTVEADWRARTFDLVDTGGWLPGGVGDELDAKVSRQSERAMEEADALLFVVDGVIGITDEDARVAALLRRMGKPTFVVVNKLDHARRDDVAWDFMKLGLGDPFACSALHGRGTGDLLDALIDSFPHDNDGLSHEEEVDVVDPTEGAGAADDLVDGETESASEQQKEAFSVAIVGRPNVGKSTLFNKLTGEENAVVHDMPGTTRDSVDTIAETEIGLVRFVDTAGMRRRARIDEDTEFYSVVRALKSVDDADVALLVIDATIGVTHQDQRLAERVDGAGCPIVIVFNKWELIDNEQKDDIDYQMERRLHFLGDSPVLKISALSGKGVMRIFPLLAEAIDQYHTRIPTPELNRVIRQAQAIKAAPGGARVMYAMQGATDPPTFTMFTNREIPRTYVRYLESAIREHAGLGSTPIKIRIRRR